MVTRISGGASAALVKIHFALGADDVRNIGWPFNSVQGHFGPEIAGTPGGCMKKV